MKIKIQTLLFFVLILSTKLNSQTCYLGLVTQSTNSSCLNSQNGAASVNPTLGFSPYTFAWSSNAGFQTSNTAVGLSAGTYTVVVTDSTGCSDTVSVTVSANPLIPPDICMVSVDDSSVYNVVYYEKTNYFNVDSFIFYRETSPGNYSRIGARPYDSLSRFFDTARSIGPVIGDPNLNSNRYKIQIRDSCGNYSALSPYHQSLFIVHLGNGNFQWSIPYEIEGLVNPVNNYALLCDTANTGGWGPVSTVSGSSNNASDPGYINHSAIANWRVVTAWNIVCNPSLRQSDLNNSVMAVIKSRSNVINNRTAGISSTLLAGLVRVFPNPATDFIEVDLGVELKSVKINLHNSFSQLVYETKLQNNNTNSKTLLDISKLSPGIYFLEIESEFYSIIKKVVIN